LKKIKNFASFLGKTEQGVVPKTEAIQDDSLGSDKIAKS